MKKPLLLLSLLTITLAFNAQITVSKSSVATSLNPSLLGLNGRSTEGPSWTDNNFLSMVAEMNPAYVRYPAGTQGNEWNWKTGTFIPGYGNSPYTFTIPMLINGLPAGSKIIYMANIVLPTAQTGITFSTTTDAVLSTDATLTAKITDILDALNEFNKNGHVPEIVELGNELYFNNTEAGVYAQNPTLYMTHAKKIAAAIKTAYPNCKIILCTTKGGTNSRDAWNNGVFNALAADTSFKNMIWGVVQHHYINDTYGLTDAVTTNATGETLIREGIQYVQESQSDYALVPSYLKLMVTEFGCTKKTADGLWVNGLRTANMTLSFMQLGTKVDNLMWHHITDDPNVLNITNMKLGPSGLAFSLLNEAMDSMTTYHKLLYSNMSATDAYATLYGFHFENDTEESILMVNWGSSTYNATNLSGLFQSSTNVLYARQYWSSSLTTSPVYSGTNVNTVKSTTLSSYNIKPYSITAIRVQKPTSGTNDALMDKLFRISTHNHRLQIQTTDNIQGDVSITDVTGKTCYSGKLTGQTTTVDMQNSILPFGILQIKSEKGLFVRKISF